MPKNAESNKEGFASIGASLASIKANLAQEKGKWITFLVDMHELYNCLIVLASSIRRQDIDKCFNAASIIEKSGFGLMEKYPDLIAAVYHILDSKNNKITNQVFSPLLMQAIAEDIAHKTIRCLAEENIPEDDFNKIKQLASLTHKLQLLDKHWMKSERLSLLAEQLKKEVPLSDLKDLPNSIISLIEKARIKRVDNNQIYQAEHDKAIMSTVLNIIEDSYNKPTGFIQAIENQKIAQAYFILSTIPVVRNDTIVESLFDESLNDLDKEELTNSEIKTFIARLHPKIKNIICPYFTKRGELAPKNFDYLLSNLSLNNEQKRILFLSAGRRWKATKASFISQTPEEYRHAYMIQAYKPYSESSNPYARMKLGNSPLPTDALPLLPHAYGMLPENESVHQLMELLINEVGLYESSNSKFWLKHFKTAAALFIASSTLTFYPTYAFSILILSFLQRLVEYLIASDDFFDLNRSNNILISLVTIIPLLISSSISAGYLVKQKYNLSKGYRSPQLKIDSSLDINGLINAAYPAPKNNLSLFYAVTMSMLFPQLNKKEDFQHQFVSLFGDENKKKAEGCRSILLAYKIHLKYDMALWGGDEFSCLSKLIEETLIKKIENLCMDNKSLLANHFNSEVFSEDEKPKNIHDYIEKLLTGAVNPGKFEIFILSKLTQQAIKVIFSDGNSYVEGNSAGSQVTIFDVSGISDKSYYLYAVDETRENFSGLMNSMQQFQVGKNVLDGDRKVGVSSFHVENTKDFYKNFFSAVVFNLSIPSLVVWGAKYVYGPSIGQDSFSDVTNSALNLTFAFSLLSTLLTPIGQGFDEMGEGVEEHATLSIGGASNLIKALTSPVLFILTLAFIEFNYRRAAGEVIYDENNPPPYTSMFNLLISTSAAIFPIIMFLILSWRHERFYVYKEKEKEVNAELENLERAAVCYENKPEIKLRDNLDCFLSENNEINKVERVRGVFKADKRYAYNCKETTRYQRRMFVFKTPETVIDFSYKSSTESKCFRLNKNVYTKVVDAFNVKVKKVNSGLAKKQIENLLIGMLIKINEESEDFFEDCDISKLVSVLCLGKEKSVFLQRIEDYLNTLLVKKACSYLGMFGVVSDIFMNPEAYNNPLGKNSNTLDIVKSLMHPFKDILKLSEHDILKHQTWQEEYNKGILLTYANIFEKILSLWMSCDEDIATIFSESAQTLKNGLAVTLSMDKLLNKTIKIKDAADSTIKDFIESEIKSKIISTPLEEYKDDIDIFISQEEIESSLGYNDTAELGLN